MSGMGTALSHSPVDCGMRGGRARLRGACVCIPGHVGKRSKLTWENKGYTASLERLTY